MAERKQRDAEDTIDVARQAALRRDAERKEQELEVEERERQVGRALSGQRATFWFRDAAHGGVGIFVEDFHRIGDRLVAVIDIGGVVGGASGRIDLLNPRQADRLSVLAARNCFETKIAYEDEGQRERLYKANSCGRLERAWASDFYACIQLLAEMLRHHSRSRSQDRFYA